MIAGTVGGGAEGVRGGWAGFGRPGPSASRRDPERIVLESGKAFHRCRGRSAAHRVQAGPLTAPPCDVVADSGFQVADDEGRAIAGGEGEPGFGGGTAGRPAVGAGAPPDHLLAGCGRTRVGEAALAVAAGCA